MADKKTLHEWLTLVIAGTALVVSSASAFFTWQGNQARKESLGITVRPTGACRIEYHGGEKAGQIGLCWSVTLANGSETRLSIIDYRLLNIQEAGTVQVGGFQTLESLDGTPLNLPLTLDGGEAKEVIVRAGTILPSNVVRAIAQLPEYQQHTLDKLSVGALETALAAEKTDFVGNAANPMLVDGKVIGFSVSSPFKRTVNLLMLTTGRGAIFHTTMTYPPFESGEH